MRLIRLPRGPTMTFKLHSYSLSRDVVSMLKRNQATQSQCLYHPLLIMNHFSGDGMHLKLMATMFQNMFPSINVNKVVIDLQLACTPLLPKQWLCWLWDRKVVLCEHSKFRIKSNSYMLFDSIRNWRNYSKFSNTYLTMISRATETRFVGNLPATSRCTHLSLNPELPGVCAYPSNSPDHCARFTVFYAPLGLVHKQSSNLIQMLATEVRI